MTPPKISPLPWRKRRAETDFDSDPAWYVGREVDEYMKHSAEVYTEEDADYIVLACNAFPKLVEALEALKPYKWHDCWCEFKPRDGFHEPQCALAREALALAKGEEK